MLALLDNVEVTLGVKKYIAESAILCDRGIKCHFLTPGIRHQDKLRSFNQKSCHQDKVPSFNQESCDLYRPLLLS